MEWMWLIWSGNRGVWAIWGWVCRVPAVAGSSLGAPLLRSLGFVAAARPHPSTWYWDRTQNCGHKEECGDIMSLQGIHLVMRWWTMWLWSQHPPLVSWGHCYSLWGTLNSVSDKRQWCQDGSLLLPQHQEAGLRAVEGLQPGAGDSARGLLLLLGHSGACAVTILMLHKQKYFI